MPSKPPSGSSRFPDIFWALTPFCKDISMCLNAIKTSSIKWKAAAKCNWSLVTNMVFQNYVWPIGTNFRVLKFHFCILIVPPCSKNYNVISLVHSNYKHRKYRKSENVIIENEAAYDIYSKFICILCKIKIMVETKWWDICIPFFFTAKQTDFQMFQLKKSQMIH